MDFNSLKKYLRLVEKPFLIAYVAIWVVTYVLSRFFLEIYTDDAPSFVWIFSLVFILPLSFYAAARTIAIKREKWYGIIGYFIMYTALWLFTSNYIIVNGDLLISSAFDQKTKVKADVIDVHKVFYKGGFDHTSVTLNSASKTITFQGRPFIYFYLMDKKNIRISTARSVLGNDYAYTDISNAEKAKARWLHFKDQIHRLRLLIAIVIVFILIGFLSPLNNLKKNSETNSFQIGFWKMMGIVMVILFSIALILYIGLLVYAKFFTHSHF